MSIFIRPNSRLSLVTSKRVKTCAHWSWIHAFFKFSSSVAYLFRSISWVGWRWIKLSPSLHTVCCSRDTTRWYDFIITKKKQSSSFTTSGFCKVYNKIWICHFTKASWGKKKTEALRLGYLEGPLWLILNALGLWIYPIISESQCSIWVLGYWMTSDTLTFKQGGREISLLKVDMPDILINTFQKTWSTKISF